MKRKRVKVNLTARQRQAELKASSFFYYEISFDFLFALRYLESKSGMYCGPLKMLAVEIAQKSNDNGVACDLITGEERKLADPDGELCFILLSVLDSCHACLKE